MFRKILFLTYLCFVVNIECKKYRYDYVYFPQIEGWLKHNEIPTTWSEARLRCHLEGAELASPLGIDILNTLKDQTQTTTWTGVHSTYSKGDYFSIGGVPILRMPITWAPGEPDNYEEKEQCIAMLSNGTFADVCCNETYPYFCYKKNTAHSIVNTCGTVDASYIFEPRTGSCYKFHNRVQIWTRAFMTCAAEGGHLAIMDTAIETQVFRELVSKYPQAKIYGLTDYKDDVLVGVRDWNQGMWITIHGQSLDQLMDTGVLRWADGQPNNATYNGLGQFCASIGRDGSLNDFWCHVPAAFICEKLPDSLEEDDQE